MRGRGKKIQKRRQGIAPKGKQPMRIQLDFVIQAPPRDIRALMAGRGGVQVVLPRKIVAKVPIKGV